VVREDRVGDLVVGDGGRVVGGELVPDVVETLGGRIGGMSVTEVGRSAEGDPRVAEVGGQGGVRGVPWNGIPVTSYNDNGRRVLSKKGVVDPVDKLVGLFSTGIHVGELQVSVDVPHIPTS